MIKKTVFLLLISLHAFTSTKVLLWDLGGVLFQPDKIGVAREIGLKHFVSYMLVDWKSPNIESLLFSVLEHMEKPESGIREKAGTGEGVPLPTIMCHWQAGTVTGPEIIKRAGPHIKLLANMDYFESSFEKSLIEKTISAMFDPKILARNVQPIKAGMELLKDCVNARNKDGTKRNRIIAFSNWDPLSFDIFHKQNAKHFKHFEHIIISGHIGLIKPRAESYHYVLKKLNLKPQDCILIDDQKINAIGAQRCGIKTLLVEDGNYEMVRDDLKMLGAL